MPNRRGTIHLDKRACTAGAAGLLLIAATAGLVSAQGTMPAMLAAEPQSQATTDEQMLQMMDAIHGEGTGERMHQAMGEDAERMMDQCVAMMTMMSAMRGMMGDAGMRGMMADAGMRGMMGDDGMRGMMGGDATRGMMGGDATRGMMGEPGRDSMSDMMRGMMGR